MIATDNPAVRYAITTAAKHNGAKIIYAHPIEDVLMQNTITQFLKYEVGTEEGVMALLAKYLLENVELSDEEKTFFDEMDDGYLSAESNIGEEELSLMMKSLSRTKNRVLVVGNDLIAHKEARNIAKLAAVIEKYTDISVLVVPRDVNTLGASLTCKLDKDDNSLENVVGYNDKGSFVISSVGEADLAAPALNQQEGTFVSIDNRVVPTNSALAFGGYELLDLAKVFGIGKKDTIDFTKELPVENGFKAVEFDLLENFLAPLGEDVRGYLLDVVEVEMDGSLDELDSLPEFNGTIIYNVNPVLQFNAYTNITKQLERETTLRGSAQFGAAARVSDGDKVEISFADKTFIRTFKQDKSLKGTIALNPTFDLDESINSYRFQKSKIMRVNHE